MGIYAYYMYIYIYIYTCLSQKIRGPRKWVVSCFPLKPTPFGTCQGAREKVSCSSSCFPTSAILVTGGDPKKKEHPTDRERFMAGLGINRAMDSLQVKTLAKHDEGYQGFEN